MLGQENLQLIDDWKGFLIDKSKKLCFKHMQDIINIPSSLYPLQTDSIEIFSTYNTFELENEKIIEIYDSIDALVGKCYSNSSNLLEEFKKNNIENIYPYAGWLMIEGQFPVHHSFLVYKEDGKNYVLDLSTTLTSSDIEYLNKSRQGLSLTTQQIREKTFEYMKTKENLPNSKKSIIGKVDPMYFYIAEQREPDLARADFNKLMAAYPNHPAYTNVNSKGQSKYQEMYYNKK